MACIDLFEATVSLLPLVVLSAPFVAFRYAATPAKQDNDMSEPLLDIEAKLEAGLSRGFASQLFGIAKLTGDAVAAC